MASNDTYKEVRIIEFPDMTVRVHIPDISLEERDRRMNAIKKAASDLVRFADSCVEKCE